MLQKVLFESSIIKTIDKSFKHQKRSSSSLSFNPISFSKKILYHKYSKFEYSFSLFCTNNLIFNEKCRIVARFKDFLVLDDTTEFLRSLRKKYSADLWITIILQEALFSVTPREW